MLKGGRRRVLSLQAQVKKTCHQPTKLGHVRMRYRFRYTSSERPGGQVFHGFTHSSVNIPGSVTLSYHVHYESRSSHPDVVRCRLDQG